VPLAIVGDKQDNTAYILKTDLDEIELPAASLVESAGTPSRAVRTYWPVWLLDAATGEAVGSVIRIPATGTPSRSPPGG
jgi:hypothetical protein